MLGKVFRTLFYMIIFLGVIWGSAIAAPQYGNVHASITCGSTPRGGIFVELRTPANSTDSALVGVVTNDQGIAYFPGIAQGEWEIWTDGKYFYNIPVQDGYTTLVYSEICNNTYYLPLIKKD